MADDQRRVEEQEEERVSEEAVDGSGDVPARDALPASLPLLHVADELREEEEEEGRWRRRREIIGVAEGVPSAGLWGRRRRS